MLTNHRLPIVAIALTVLVGACVAIAVSNRRADRSLLFCGGNRHFTG